MTALPPSPNEMQQPPESDGFNVWNPEILSQIDALIAVAAPQKEGEDNWDLVRQLIVTALKTEHAQLRRGDVKILSRSLRELRYGFRIFKDYHNRRKVTIFGSARTPSTDPEYRQALVFAQLMASQGFMTITGAGPGIMEAGNEGAGLDNSFGINIRLPYEQAANKFIDKNPRFIDCRFFFTRKLMFLKETSAVAFFPGGFGTHDEAMETLTLVQTGKSDPMPVVFIDAPGGDYWTDWDRYIDKQLLQKKKISSEDLNLYKITDSAEEAVKEITRFYSNYHSMRFVKDQLVMRLQRPLTPEALESINREFRDICLSGGFCAAKAFPEEQDYAELPRLAFQFNRINFGRLRQLINRLNDPPQWAGHDVK